MDERTRERVAVGASVGAHCQPCLTYHVTKAREMGITDDEIREAIQVGHRVEKGAMAAMRTASSALLEVSGTTPAACCGPTAAKGSGCCP